MEANDVALASSHVGRGRASSGGSIRAIRLGRISVVVRFACALSEAPNSIPSGGGSFSGTPVVERSSFLRGYNLIQEYDP
jgi:hypothetical protein